MARRHPESGINPPFNKTRDDQASNAEVYEAHKNSGINAFYDLNPESRPRCTGNPGCPCENCCKMRGREAERQRGGWER